MRRKLLDLKRKFGNNGGFTLVELLTSLSIFAFFSIALLQYMKTASSIQAQVNSAVGLETAGQVAFGVVEEYLIDASASVMFDNNTLYIVNNYAYGETSGNSCVVHAFEYRPSSKEVYYRTTNATIQKITTTVNTTYYKQSTVDDTNTNIDEFYREKVTTVTTNDSTNSSYPRVTKEYATVSGFPPESSSTVTVIDATLTSIPNISYREGWWEKKDYESTSSVVFNGLSLDSSLDELLCSNVTEFKVTGMNDGDEFVEEGKIQKVFFSFAMENNRSDYQKSGYVVLRNQPPVGTM